MQADYLSGVLVHNVLFRPVLDFIPLPATFLPPPYPTFLGVVSEKMVAGCVLERFLMQVFGGWEELSKSSGIELEAEVLALS